MKSTNIDILPMAAVGLILVLAMMVIAPMVMSHNDTPVDVPQTRTAERKVEENTTITYTDDGRLLLNDKPCPDLAEVETRLEMELVRDPYVLVVVRADKDVYHSQVLDILAAARRAGAMRIACATKKMQED
ncbi:biopolymer transporter ExbD [candidate division WOR-3 bacterium]|nr:biopolymer transporter ExbD [candidate division WOR-3 bacterium]